MEQTEIKAGLTQISFSLPRRFPTLPSRKDAKRQIAREFFHCELGSLNLGGGMRESVVVLDFGEEARKGGGLLFENGGWQSRSS